MNGPGGEEQPEAPQDAGTERQGEGDAAADGGDRAARARATEATESERRIEEILTAAEIRDKQADARDSEAYRRDMAANLDAFIRRIDDDDAYRARSQAAKDRAQARADRVASKLDRHLLTGLSPNADEREQAATTDRPDARHDTDDTDDTDDNDSNST
jgi:hypothetical protein